MPASVVRDIFSRVFKELRPPTPDRATILLFVHGELDQEETQKVAARIETDEKLRKEFEAVLALSDNLEDYFAKQPKSKTKNKTTKASPVPEESVAPARSRWPYLLAGGATFMLVLGVMIFLQMKPTGDHAAESAPADEISAAQPDAASMAEAPPQTADSAATPEGPSI
ncbi:MAG: hypothetical protein HC883_05530 [Bdellovibrionaceae bacterium]|nr:hypothetical protein [Pseudobdellovibrionaceae bacterium]